MKTVWVKSYRHPSEYKKYTEEECDSEAIDTKEKRDEVFDSDENIPLSYLQSSATYVVTRK